MSELFYGKLCWKHRNRLKRDFLPRWGIKLKKKRKQIKTFMKQHFLLPWCLWSLMLCVCVRVCVFSSGTEQKNSSSSEVVWNWESVLSPRLLPASVSALLPPSLPLSRTHGSSECLFFSQFIKFALLSLTSQVQSRSLVVLTEQTLLKSAISCLTYQEFIEHRFHC